MSGARRIPHVNRVGRVHRTDVWERLGVAVCGALFLGFAISYLSLLVNGSAGIKMTDFVPYYSAGLLVVHGHGAALYDLHLVGRVESRLVHPLQVRNGVMPYLYPPHVALAMSALALFPYSIAFMVWLAVNCGSFVASMAMLRRYIGARGPAGALLWLAAASFLPVLVALGQGQMSLVLLFLFVAALLALRGGHEVTAGVLVALALIKPPYVVPILMVLLLQRRFRALTAFVASVGLFAAVSSLLLGSPVWRAYLQTLVHADSWQTQIGGFAPRWNHSLSGLAGLLLPARGARVAVLCLVALTLVFLVYIALRSPEIDIPFAAAVICALLLSPHVLVHDLTLLILPAAVAVRHRVRGTAALAILLSLGDLATIIGLPLVSRVPIQLSVLSMLALAAYLAVLPVAAEPVSLPQKLRSFPRAVMPNTVPHALVKD